MFRVCVTGEVRFGQGHETSDASFPRELVPNGAHRSQPEVRDDRVKKTLEACLIPQSICIAASSLNEPFDTYEHLQVECRQPAAKTPKL